MDLIERAAAKLAKSPKSSLIERAGRKFGADLDGPQDTPRPDDIPANTRGVAPAAAPPKPEAAENVRRPGAPAPRRATIDFERVQASGVVVHHDAKTRCSEEFRRIKRPVLLKAFGDGPDRIENGNLIMVTSARPGEGKTFTALNLALSIATERDLTVLLIDADMSNPTIPSVLGIETGPGLADLLQQEDLDVGDILVRTDRENLGIITAGAPHPHAAELLASDRMSRLVREIAERYSDRVIIFDTPPVLASSEAAVIAMHAGQTIFVVESEGTGESDVAAALNIISSCKNIGFVLNKTRSNSNSKGYGAYARYPR